MKHFTLPGEPPVDVRLRRSPRARRVSLRVSRSDGAVTLSLPARLPLDTALAFARDKEPWLRRVLAKMPAPRRVGVGDVLPFEGRQVQLVAAPLARARLMDQVLLVPPGAAAGPAAAAFLRHAARSRLTEACRRHAAALGRDHGRITLRDTRSRWGSCTAQGNLNFSWRLVMAPPAILDYVAAHEVAHLVEMNHSAAFWTVVARLCPGHAGARAWLRAEGGHLQALRFDD